MVYQIIVFTNLTGSISSTLPFPHYCVVHLFISVFEDFDFDFLNFLSLISSVTEMKFFWSLRNLF